MLSLKVWKNMAMSKIATMEGRAVATAPTMPPFTPFSFKPICDAISMAKSPGVLCATTSVSINSSWFSQCFLSTTSFSIICTMAKPPPMVKLPILANVRKRSV